MTAVIAALGCGTNDLARCMFRDFANAFGGEPTFGVFVGGVVMISLWIASPRQSIAAPAALTILLGSLLFPVLPGSYQEFAWTFIVIGLAAALLSVARRYVLDPGAR